MSQIENTQEIKPTSISLWIQAMRPFAFPASIVPILFGIIYTISYVGSPVYWELVPLIVVAGVLFHAGVNLVSEYYDLKKGVDRKHTFGSSKVLVDELLPAKKVLNAGFATFAFGLILGLIMVFSVPEPNFNLLIIGLVGLAGGVFYTGKPIGYKYFALGDLLVFVLMGPLMVMGTYTALTGIIDWELAIYSLPIGFLVAAILNANNIRDIMHDKEANIKTVATIIGMKNSKLEYFFLVFGAFIAVIVFVLMGLLTPWTLLVFLSLPPALANLKMIAKAEESKPELIAIADIKTAQHHLLFGVLYSIGLLLGIII